MEEITYVFLFPILSLPLIFTSVAISIFHFLTAATKVNCYVLFFSTKFASFVIHLNLRPLSIFYVEGSFFKI